MEGEVVAVLVLFMSRSAEAQRRQLELVSGAAEQLGVVMEHRRLEGMA